MSAPPQFRHVILDRDGVLNIEPGDHQSVRDASQWQWITGAREALATLARAGVRISVATNQAAIGRRVVTRAAVDAIHARMLAEAAAAGGAIECVWVCPHAPDDRCGCRKPLPGLVLQAVEASGIPADASIVVGDDLRDLQAAQAAGVPAVLVRTGKGRATEAMLPRGHVEVFDDLLAFARAATSTATSRASGSA